MDLREAFFGSLWVVAMLVPVGVAGSVFLQLGILWAAGPAVLVAVVSLGLVASVLARRDRKAARQREQGIVSALPEYQFHWRSVTPAALIRRLGADLDEINVDDTALEDELEPLYEHGNKMDNGFSGGWR